MRKWRVHDTPMHPARYKVNCYDDPLAGDNDPVHYFRTYAEAAQEANRRNERELEKEQL